MEEIITTSEVATLLKVYVETIYHLAAGGKLSRIWRFNRSEVGTAVQVAGSTQK